MPEVTFTSPSDCAECGGSIREEMARAEGLAPVAFQVEGHVVTVPGLYSHGPCAEAIMDGKKETRVTMEAALEYLAEVFIPSVIGYMVQHDGDEHEAASSRLDEAVKAGEILAMASLLELMEEVADEKGVEPEDMAIVVIEDPEQHPRELATFN